MKSQTMRLLSAGLLGMLLMYALQGLGYKLRLLFRSGNGVEPVPVPRYDQGWQACHQQHVEQIQRADEAEEGYGLMFFGDSITEEWESLSLCTSCAGQPRCDGVAAVFHRHWDQYRPAVMAIAGDQVAHLLWRLRNGEVPQKHQPKVAVLLIGTNDLGAAEAEAPSIWQAEEAVVRAVPGVTLRVLQTLHTFKDLLPQTHVILMALLPRGGPGFGPGRTHHWPSLYTQPFNMVNAHFRDYTRLDGYLHFIDCGDRFLTPDGKAIDARLMNDALHPSAEGHELLAQCLDPLIHKLMLSPTTEEASAADQAP